MQELETLRDCWAQRSGASVTLLYVDLDDFKHVNDTLGHEKGDRLLQEMALRLPRCVRANDAIARLGGDEFIVVLDVAGPQQAARTAEKILETICAPFELDGLELRMSASHRCQSESFARGNWR
jgi:diguanylate cyclase (GGDEF)-like protein